MESVAIYCRLSKEDGDDTESNSIKTQKMIIESYCKRQGWEIYDTYVDDGYSGTNFDRPGFQRMYKDIADTKVNVVITKDLSRLGRNYILTGYYYQVFFPEAGVRYIAVNDHIDTKNENNDMAMAAFKNIMNDLYSRNLRRNVQAALQARIENKQFCRGHAPYGYTVNRELKKLLPDENYADTVKYIFDEYLNNQNFESLARKLDQQGIPPPSARLLDRHNCSNGRYSTKWSASMLCQMITNPAYMGALSFARERKKSPYTQSRYRIPIKEQTIIYDCHEAIIPREVWESVNQKYLEFQHKKMVYLRENLYRGVLYCAHCGSTLKMNKGTSASSYYCKCWPVTSKTKLSERTLKVSALDRFLTKEIHNLAVSIEDDNANAFLYLSDRLKGAQHYGTLDKEVEAFQIQKRIDVINDKITNYDLYCKTRNFSLKEKQTVLSALNSSLENESQNLKKCEDAAIVRPTVEDIALFIQKARKFGYIKEIDHEAVKELIDKIYVKRKENDSWFQQNRIKIKYKYIGQL
jgi:site-specific DNA recombinase